MKKLFGVISLFVFCFMPCLSSAQENDTSLFNKAKSQWTFSAGFGKTYPGLGDTKTSVEDYDVILKYGEFLSEQKGSSWYRGRHEILFEIPLYYVTRPESAIMVGLNVLACWNFTAASETVIPYVFAGGGPIYTNLDLPDLGAELNGNYQAGTGFHYFLTRNIAVDFTVRYDHISNGGTANPNIPLNSIKILMGISFFR